METKEHQVLRGNQVHLDPPGIGDLLVLLDLQEIRVLKVLQDHQDQQAKVDRPDQRVFPVL